MNNNIEKLANYAFNQFRASGFPSSPLRITNNFLELEIRLPHALPNFLLNKYNEDFKTALTACPSIEVIRLHKKLQGQGFFNLLVEKIGTLPSVECISVSNVSNPEFDKYLSSHKDWQLLELQDLSKSIVMTTKRLNSYYKLTT
jgi:hypothetical protein